MKDRLLSIIILPALLASIGGADTSVSVRLGVESGDVRRGDRHVEDRDHRGYWAYDRYGNRRYFRRNRMVEGVPVVIIPAPPVPQPVVAGLTGDYATDLANLTGKLVRLRTIVQRQKQNDFFSQEQYDRFMNTLDAIEQDEHSRAFDQGGNLNPEDFTDLYRRLNQAGEDIETALAG